MATTARTRPSHYETLGLRPDATSEEIARAFAREVSPVRPRAFGGIAEVCIAFETLRDPAKRRAYDDELGLGRAEKAAALVAAEAHRQADYLFAGALAGAAKPAAVAEVEPAPAAEPELAQPWLEDFREYQRARAEAPLESGDAAGEGEEVEWKKPGLILGGLMASVALLGALAGWWSSSDIGEEEQVAEAAETVPLPPPSATRPAPAEEQAVAAAETPPPVEQPEQVGAAPAPAPVQRAEPAEGLESIESFLDEAPQVAEPAEPPALAAAEPEAAAPATLPLPNRVVARTIERIGYDCGEVASVAAVDGGSAGAFKVTCSSGDAYRAAPIGGRYHFRRWDRR